MSALESVLLAVFLSLALAKALLSHLMPALERYWGHALWILSLP